MKLSVDEAKRFYTIWWSLLCHVNQELNLIKNLPREIEIGALPLENGSLLRTELWQNPELLDSFVATNPADLSACDLSVASSWSRRIEGEFFLFRHLKKYSVFLSTEDLPMAFGVHGIATGLDEMSPGRHLPVLVKAVLLPFENKLIYDSFLFTYNISFGGGIKKSLNQSYSEAKSCEGIITSLPAKAHFAEVGRVLDAGSES